MNTLVAPPFCAHCRQFLTERMIFCDVCNDAMLPIVSKSIHINKQYSMHVLAASKYQDPIKSLIISKSYRNIAAAAHLGELIWEHTYFDHMPCDYIVPVPLHWRRFAQRGYNQAAEIAYTLSQKRNIPVIECIARIKHTPFQSSLPFDKRSENVKKIFILKNGDYSFLKDKHIFLVDDLMTTGSTLRQVAQVLSTLQPASINAIVAARAE